MRLEMMNVEGLNIAFQKRGGTAPGAKNQTAPTGKAPGQSVVASPQGGYGFEFSLRSSS